MLGMWTQARRGSMAEFEKRSDRYTTDLADEERRFIQPFLLPMPRGRQADDNLHEVLGALRCLARTALLANAAEHYLPWQTVYRLFRRFIRRLLFHTIHDVALMLDRERKNREQSPSAAIVDSQSIKAPGAVKRGFDAGKKVVRRKRPIRSTLMADYSWSTLSPQISQPAPAPRPSSLRSANANWAPASLRR